VCFYPRAARYILYPCTQALGRWYGGPLSLKIGAPLAPSALKMIRGTLTPVFENPGALGYGLVGPYNGTALPVPPPPQVSTSGPQSIYKIVDEVLIHH
jgi:hypothetical protein